MKQIFITLLLLTLLGCNGTPDYRFEQDYRANLNGTFDIEYYIYQDDDKIHSGTYIDIPYDKTDSVLDAHYIVAKNYIDQCKNLDKKLKHGRNKFK